MSKSSLIEHLKAEGFPDNIVSAFSKIKREDFIPKDMAKLAYDDVALPLEKGATISQPSTIAFMLHLLELEDGNKVLEIGSGSGYVLALLDKIIKDGEILGIEISPSLAKKSKRLLDKVNNKIKVINQNGIYGLPFLAPFDRIIISATADKVPKHLYSQLKDKGIIVAPVRNSIWQVKKDGKVIDKKKYPGFVFVPLVEDDSIFE